ncbi:ATP-binding protein [Candidatus Parcubacteria bacterium]|nr:MAG: ATP-binding protein [Candidatus Parcubacteria bacterium]
MDIRQLETLLQQKESERLEFKRELDLNTKAGKAKLLKETLALANALPAGERAWLIIGVEDSGEVIGLQHEVTEEQVQQILREWCRPPIGVRFEVQEFKQKRLGILTIYGSRPPHTLNRDFKTEHNGKTIAVKEKEVYVRRGSTIDTATPEEVTHMAQSRTSSVEALIPYLDEINYQLGDVSGALRDLAWEMHDAPDAPDRSVETAFVGMLGVISFLVWDSRVLEPLALSLSILFWATTLTAMRILHFGILRGGVTAVLFSSIYFLFTLALPDKLLSSIFIQVSAVNVLYLAGVGWLCGILTAQIIGWLEVHLR